MITLPPERFDKEGFLRDLNAWSPAVAKQIAAAEDIALSDEHWEVIELLRRYYQEFEASPAMRALVKYTRIHLGDDKGRSIYLLRLFPGSPAKLGSKIAGLPKPENCL
ncbi:TusE/DsrC/DsvC family sulfur relay protein [Halieaceae bacterium IMCC14734]|uniref:Sulfurtransferase n=1 Tax=Candidatus Litorirhabdus singularis TaxID=2518993 RepID=A0ABT3TGR1_9GAMM|nr:TusE/DsrC/DsvC family sulfur relay protein [Candidatus Litorirhabdus singularis]MCX2981390.1 TusE/DsrC/DsvC family sulfur relay protein [Candidatus Litorirhabdus singularis]